MTDTDLEEVSYETKRDHIRKLIKSHPKLTLAECCGWIGKPRRTQLSYVSQVLSGKYGKSKRSPNVVNSLIKAVKEKGYWFEIGNIPEEFKN